MEVFLQVLINAPPTHEVPKHPRTEPSTIAHVPYSDLRYGVCRQGEGGGSDNHGLGGVIGAAVRVDWKKTQRRDLDPDVPVLSVIVLVVERNL